MKSFLQRTVYLQKRQRVRRRVRVNEEARTSYAAPGDHAWILWRPLVSAEVWILFVSSTVHCWRGWAAWEEFGGVSNANRRQLQKVRGTFQKQLVGSVLVAGWCVLVALSCVRSGFENPALLKTTFNTLKKLATTSVVYLLNWS